MSAGNIAADIFSLLFIVSCFGYLGWRALEKSEDRARLIFKWILSAIMIGGGVHEIRACLATGDMRPIPIIAMVLGLALACVWVNTIANKFANPIGAWYDGGSESMEAKPIYSWAEAKRRKGFPREAAELTRMQLAKFPNDFPGVLLLATILAEDLHNVPEAEAAIEEYISRPKQTPQAISAALQNLADLQLRFGGGSSVATATLQRLVDAYPDTNFAHAALQRIAHLEAADQTRQHREEVRYAVPLGEKDVGLRTGLKVELKAGGPEEEAERLVAQLERHPMDVESREKLAVLYAQEFGRVDLAVDQMEQLIALRTESPRRIGGWLNLLATIHAKFGNDFAGAENALRRITERFPKSTVADAAANRLASLRTEVNVNVPTSLKTLGVYEKQVGLKNAGAPVENVK